MSENRSTEQLKAGFKNFYNTILTIRLRELEKIRTKYMKIYHFLKNPQASKTLSKFLKNLFQLCPF